MHIIGVRVLNIDTIVGMEIGKNLIGQNTVLLRDGSLKDASMIQKIPWIKNLHLT